MNHAFLLICLFSLPFSAIAKNTHHYQVKIDDQLQTLFIKACFSKRTISGLKAGEYPGNEGAHAIKLLKTLTLPNNGKFKKVRGQIYFKQNIKNACIKYQVELTKLDKRYSESHFRYKGPEKIIAPYYWLWLPQDYSEKDTLLIHFDFPAKINYSVPWPIYKNSNNNGKNTNKTYYVHNYASTEWPANTVFGRFAKYKLNIGKTSLRLAILNQTQTKPIKAYVNWVQVSAQAINSLFGQFPGKSIQIVLTPVGSKGEPVPFGQVLRGGAAAVQLFIDPTRTITEFLADWTASHEMSHLFLPYVQRADAWLSEGLATYYQNILRVRVKQLTEQQAWQKLHEGFQRGIRGTGKLTLRDASINMHENHAYMRVYWSGTAIVLLADLELRKLSQGNMSMDIVLAEINRCCLQAGKTWSAKKLMNKMDQISRTKVFSQLYQQHTFSAQFPNLRQVYKDLGIVIVNDTVQFNPQAKYSKYRKQMTHSK